jgi:uncharacterized protein (DUF1697 family)
MALVVFLKGINVGGHRNFRPSAFAKELTRFDVVNVGAAGTFVIRKPPGRAQIRTELARRLPFAAEVMICNGDDIVGLARSDPFKGYRARSDIIWFVSILARRRPARLSVPLQIPTGGEWGVKVLACRGRFVLGLYRRQMKAIGYLGRLEKIFGVPVTTRNWNTILAIARILKGT